jgi:hypothetical protein
VISFASKEHGIIDAKMFKFTNIQHIIPPPAARMNNAVSYNFPWVIGIKVAELASRIILI